MDRACSRSSFEGFRDVARGRDPAGDRPMNRLACLAVFASLGCAMHPGAPVEDVRDVPTPAPKEIVYLQPLGKDLPQDDVELVKTALEEFFPIEVRILDRTDLPSEAWYAPRQRWRADKLL